MEIIIAVAAVGVLFLYRKIRISKLTEKVEGELPDRNVLVWLPDSSDRYQEAKSKRDLAEAGAIGALGSIPSFYYLSQLDENVIEAMDFAFAQDLSNFNDLHDYINDKYLEALHSDSAEGWMTRLEGYVNEQYAADVLTKLGYEVEFPDAANQEGWDLLVDGEPWQVKGGETPSIISEHLANHPDIPVVTSDVLKSHFADQDHVLGFQELNPDVIHQATEQTFNAADSLGDTVGIGVPVVALATSGFREFNLLTSGKTELAASLKNIGLDVAGTGGGGLVGAKIGAAIGAVGGPFGMAIGGALGAIGGAILGRAGSNYVKNASFKAAAEDYHNQLQQSKIHVEQSTEQKRMELEHRINSINNKLNHARSELDKQYSLQMQEIVNDQKEKHQSFVTITPELLRGIKDELKEVEKRELGKIKRSGLIRQLVAPAENDVFYMKAKKWFAQRYDILDDAISRFSVLPMEQHLVEHRYKEIIRFFREHPADHDLLHTRLEDLLSNGGKDVRERFRAQMFQEIDQAENSIRSDMQSIFQDILNTITIQKEIIEEKMKKLRKEAGKLGMDI